MSSYGALSDGSQERTSEPWYMVQKKKRCMPRWLKQLIAVLVYYAIGCIYYGLSPSLQWEPFKVFYFICVSITTCGYGDVVPTTDPDKLFTIVYVTFGIAVVFGAISEAATMFFQQLEEKAEAERKRKEKERLLSEGLKEEAVPENDDDIWRHERMKVFFYISTVVVVMIIGGTVVSVVEGMSFISGLYWAFQTTTTVGYGDESRETVVARAIASAYLLLSCGVVGSALAGIAGAKDATKRELKQRNLLRKQLDMDMITALDTDGDGVDRAEFVAGMLVAMGLVDSEITQQLFHRFAELDVDNSGTLDADDLRRGMSSRRLSFTEGKSAATVNSPLQSGRGSSHGRQKASDIALRVGTGPTADSDSSAGNEKSKLNSRRSEVL